VVAQSESAILNSGFWSLDSGLSVSADVRRSALCCPRLRSLTCLRLDPIMMQTTRRTYSAVIHREEDLYVADCPEVGTVSQGSSIDEALANLKEATELYLEEFPRSIDPPPVDF